MRQATRLAVLAGLFALAAIALQLPDLQTPPSDPGVAPVTPTPTPVATAPEPLTAAQINRQDRTSAAQRRRETRAFDRRPLLAALPIELAGVRIDIAGLAADQRTTILELTPGPRGRAYAWAVYRRALAALGDSGHAYSTRWAAP